MPPKRPSPPPAEDPPAGSSSEPVETDESDEESSGEEVLPAQTLKPKQDKKPSSSADESGSDSDSDSDAPPPPKLKISKPPVVDSPSKKNKLKPASKAVTPEKLSVKRPVESSEDGEASKRAKKKHAEADLVTPEKKAKQKDVEAADPVESEKKLLFQRLWSEKDEIVILKGLIDFPSEKGVDPSTDTEGFYNFIKESLVSAGNRNQLVDKLRRLKKKYKNHASKVKDGKDKTFSNPHEQLSYDLSKIIWGGDDSVNGGGSVDQSKSNGKAKAVTKSENALPQAEKQELIPSIRVPDEGSPKKDVSKESVLLHEGVGFGGLDESVVRRGLGLIDSAKRMKLEEKWKNLLVAETELFLRRSELNRELSMLVLDAYKKL